MRKPRKPLSAKQVKETCGRKEKGGWINKRLFDAAYEAWRLRTGQPAGKFIFL